MQSIGAPNTGKLQRCWSGFRGSQNNAERAGAPVQQQKEGELGVFTLEERKESALRYLAWSGPDLKSGSLR